MSTFSLAFVCVCWGAYFTVLTFLLTLYLTLIKQVCPQMKALLQLPYQAQNSLPRSFSVNQKENKHWKCVPISPHTPAPNSWPITGRRQAVFARGGDLTSISLFFPSNVTDSENDQDDIYPCRRVHAHCVVYNALHNCSTVNFL